MTLSGTMALHASYLRLLPDKNMVRMIMELVQNQSFTLTAGDSEPNLILHLKNNIPQGSILAALLFNLFMSTSTSALQNFKQVYLRRQFSIVALCWKLKGLCKDFRSTHDYTFSVCNDGLKKRGPQCKKNRGPLFSVLKQSDKAISKNVIVLERTTF